MSLEEVVVRSDWKNAFGAGYFHGFKTLYEGCISGGLKAVYSILKLFILLRRGTSSVKENIGVGRGYT